MVLSVRQLLEKCREKRVPLHIAIIDLTKAFDSVSREGLYIILRKLGCPQKLLNLIRSLHMGMMATVAYENEESKAFPVNNRVKQGCVLAPMLFNIYFSYLIRHASKETMKASISDPDMTGDCLTFLDSEQRPQ